MNADTIHKYIGIAYEVGSGVALVLAGAEALFPNAKWLQTAAAKLAAIVFDLKKLTGGDS